MSTLNRTLGYPVDIWKDGKLVGGEKEKKFGVRGVMNRETLFLFFSNLRQSPFWYIS